MKFLLAVSPLLLAGCATMQPTSFTDNRPIFRPDMFFTGHTESKGVMENRGGTPTREVFTKTDGKWQDGELRIEQDLTFGDKPPSHRSWRLRRIDEHHLEATANDIRGTARGEVYGNAFHWSFVLKTSPGNPLLNVHMSQWMYLQPDGRTMVNHTTFTKGGIVVAQVTEQFHKMPNR
jgi:hypothetical protein